MAPDTDIFDIAGLTRKEAVHRLLTEIDEKVLLAKMDEATAKLLADEYVGYIMQAAGKHRRREER